MVLLVVALEAHPASRERFRTDAHPAPIFDGPCDGLPYAVMGTVTDADGSAIDRMFVRYRGTLQDTNETGEYGVCWSTWYSTRTYTVTLTFEKAGYEAQTLTESGPLPIIIDATMRRT